MTSRDIDYDNKNVGDKYVFGYKLGIYYEVDLKHSRANVEFYKDGIKSSTKEYKLK